MILYHSIKKHLPSFLCLSSLCLICSCKTLWETQQEDIGMNHITRNQEGRILSLESTTNSLKFRVNMLEEDDLISKKIIAQLKNDLQSLQEQNLSNKKNIEIIKRALRSGVLEDTSQYKTDTTGLTMLPDINNASVDVNDINKIDKIGKIDKKESNIEKIKSPELSKAISPEQLLADVELKIQNKKYQEAIVGLNKIQQDFPNYDSNGKTYLLTAEAWIEQKEFDNAFPAIHTFYLRYPSNSIDLPKAKYLEALAYEGIGSKESAARLYQEVITLSPQGNIAQQSRNNLLGMRDAK